MKKGLALLSMLAVTMFGAGQAHALRGYVAEAPHVCSAKSGRSHVGCFNLAKVGKDQKVSGGCSIGSACSGPGFLDPLANVLGLVTIPAAAVVNEAWLIVSMPTRKSERLN